MMKKDQVRKSWKLNADEWIGAIENHTIGSRTVTNPAIVELIIEKRPFKILDAGCGEGWLSRSLHKQGIETIGIDGTEELIAAASSKGNVPFYTMSVEQIIAGEDIPQAPFEAVVFNFCLYLDNEVELLLKAVANHLIGRKLIFIQTLHPMSVIADGLCYENQWIEDSWKGLVGAFTSPHRWYFRTLEGWYHTFEKSGLKLLCISEPLLIDKSKPASIIFTAASND